MNPLALTWGCLQLTHNAAVGSERCVHSWDVTGFQTEGDDILHIDEVVWQDTARFKCIAVNVLGQTDVWVTNVTVMGELCASSF